MGRLEWLALQKNAVIAYQHEVTQIKPEGTGYSVFYRGPSGAHESIKCSWLINSAGLSSDYIASLLGIDVDKAGYRLFPCKGEYFTIPFSRSKLISHLIYPPPFKDLRGLGIHITKSIDGRTRLGPNAFFVDKPDYTVEPKHARVFYNSIKQYLPFLKESDLAPDMAGIRPKLQSPGSPIQDFVVCHEKKRGLKCAVNLIGIESPGLTSCLSLAKMVSKIIEEEQ